MSREEGQEDVIGDEQGGVGKENSGEAARHGRVGIKG
jgi:hypothetical protein